VQILRDPGKKYKAAGREWEQHFDPPSFKHWLANGLTTLILPLREVQTYSLPFCKARGRKTAAAAAGISQPQRITARLQSPRPVHHSHWR